LQNTLQKVDIKGIWYFLKNLVLYFCNKYKILGKNIYFWVSNIIIAVTDEINEQNTNSTVIQTGEFKIQ